MPGEIATELVAMIGLDPLNRDRQASANLIDEGNRVGDRVPRVDLQHTVAGRRTWRTRATTCGGVLKGGLRGPHAWAGGRGIRLAGTAALSGDASRRGGR
jgi:hypothetical protein